MIYSYIWKLHLNKNEMYILIIYYLYILYDRKIKIVSVVMKLLAVGRPL